MKLNINVNSKLIESLLLIHHFYYCNEKFGPVQNGNFFDLKRKFYCKYMDSCKVLSKTPGLIFYTLTRGSVEEAVGMPLEASKVSSGNCFLTALEESQLYLKLNYSQTLTHS